MQHNEAFDSLGEFDGDTLLSVDNTTLSKNYPWRPDVDGGDDDGESVAQQQAQSWAPNTSLLPPPIGCWLPKPIHACDLLECHCTLNVEEGESWEGSLAPNPPTSVERRRGTEGGEGVKDGGGVKEPTEDTVPNLKSHFLKEIQKPW